MVKKSGSRSKHNSTAADEGVPTRSQRREVDTVVPPAFSIGRIDIFDVGREVSVRKQRYRLNKMRMTCQDMVVPYSTYVPCDYVVQYVRTYGACAMRYTTYIPYYADVRSKLTLCSMCMSCVDWLLLGFSSPFIFM